MNKLRRSQHRRKSRSQHRKSRSQHRKRSSTKKRRKSKSSKKRKNMKGGKDVFNPGHRQKSININTNKGAKVNIPGYNFLNSLSLV